MKGKCCWVLSDNTYCMRKTEYKIKKDDDYNSIRVYLPFCPEHQRLSDKEDQLNPSWDMLIQ